MNESMRPIWAEAQTTVDAGHLDESLQAKLVDGLELSDGGLLFATHLRKTSLRRNPNDLTGWEADVNKVCLDELVDTDLPGWAGYCVGQGALLGRAVLEAAAGLTSMPVDVLISADLGDPTRVGDEMLSAYPSSTFRFYRYRPDNLWTTEELAGMMQPVARLRFEAPTAPGD